MSDINRSIRPPADKPAEPRQADAHMAILMQQEIDAKEHERQRAKLFFVKIPLVIAAVLFLWLASYFIRGR